MASKSDKETQNNSNDGVYIRPSKKKVIVFMFETYSLTYIFN